MSGNHGLQDYRRKIVSAETLRTFIADARRVTDAGERGPVFVHCHGCFDIVHPGHIRYLQFARGQGDYLIVSITGDADIHKGQARPYIPQELRAENLAALELVDFVVIDPNPTAARLLDILRPDVYVKGEEYATSRDPRFLEEKQVVEGNGGRVIFSSGQVVFSSTRLGESIAAPVSVLEHLGVVCRRHGITAGAMSSLMQGFKGLRVLVFGDAYLERYVLCDTGAVAGESPMMSLAELDRRDYLGGAALLATQLAALGARPLLVTMLGDDPDSQKTLAALQQRRVRVLCPARRAEVPIRTRYLVDEHKMFKVDRGGPSPLDSTGRRRVMEMLLAEASLAQAAVLFDAGYGVISPALMQQIGPAVRERLPVVSGGSGEPQGTLAHFRDLDLLCTSERRLRSTLGDPSGGLSPLAYRLLDQTQAMRMLVTVGKRGLVTFDRPSHDRTSPAWRDRLLSEYLPSLSDRVVDRLGCGESILAAASLCLAGGATMMQTAYLCQVIGAIQISRMGPMPVTNEDLHHALTMRPELSRQDSDPPRSPLAPASETSAHAIFTY